jgi:hypothetical protein
MFVFFVIFFFPGKNPWFRELFWKVGFSPRSTFLFESGAKEG